MTRLDELYGRYLVGHALGRQGRPRPTPPPDAKLDEWSLELGYADGLAAAPVRAERQFARWCVGYEAYRRGTGREGPLDRGALVEAGLGEAATAELCELLGSRDERSGERRSPLVLDALLRSLPS